MMKENPLQDTGSPSVKSNIVIFLFLLYWLCIPHAVYAVEAAWLTAPMSMRAYSITMFTVRFVPPILVYLLFCKNRPMAVLSMTPLPLKTVLYIVVITASVRVIEFLLEFGIPFVFGIAPGPMPQMGSVWTHLLVAVVIASLYEELLFRGVLYSEYRRRGVSIAKIALVSGLFFGLVHSGIVSIAASAILGVLWVYLLYYTRSIWAPILSHAIYNGLWQIHPAFRIETQAEYEAFLPRFVLILSIAAVIVIPAMVVCAKRFWAENRREMETPAKESKAFVWSYWALIAAMVVVIVVFRI